jgi:hypothetical protein
MPSDIDRKIFDVCFAPKSILGPFLRAVATAIACRNECQAADAEALARDNDDRR